MKGLSPKEKRDLILSVGTHRTKRRLQPVEVAELIQKSLSAGGTLEEASNEISLSTRVLQKFTSLLSLPPDTQIMIGWGSDSSTVSFTAAAEISRLKTAHEQKFLAEAVLEHQLNVPEIKQVVQIRQRSQKSIEDSVEAVLKQRPVVEKRHLIIGKLLSEELGERLKHMAQQERNGLLYRALNQRGPGTPPYGAKLGTEYYIIVCDDHYYKALTSLSGDLENSITQYLLLELTSEE